MAWNIQGEANVQKGFGLPLWGTSGFTAYTPARDGVVILPNGTDLDRIPRVWSTANTQWDYIIPVFTGATSATTGTSLVGLVPSATSGDTASFLKGDGTWGSAGNNFYHATGLTELTTLYPNTASGDTAFLTSFGTFLRSESGTSWQIVSQNNVGTTAAQSVVNSNLDINFRLGNVSQITVSNGMTYYASADTNSLSSTHTDNSTNFSLGSLYKLTLDNTSSTATTFNLFGLNDPMGQEMQPITVDGNEKLSLYFQLQSINSTTLKSDYRLAYPSIINYFTGATSATTASTIPALVPPATSGDTSAYLRGDGTWASLGALSKEKAIASAQTLVGDAIYTLIQSGGSFSLTLPAATGSQDRIYFLSENLNPTTAVTIGVQTGDYVNGTLNGSLVTSASNEMYLAVDSHQDNWVLQRMGSNTDRLHRLSVNLLASGVLVGILSHSTTSSTPNVVAGAGSKVTFSQSDLDAGYSYGTSGDPSNNRFVIQETGIYHITSTFAGSNNSTGEQSYQIVKNESEVLVNMQAHDTVVNSDQSQTVTWIGELSALDTIDCRYFAQAGTTRLIAWNFTINQLPEVEVIDTNAGINYSTSEQATDRYWVDGKRIYEKTVKLDSTTTPTAQTFASTNASAVASAFAGISQPIMVEAFFVTQEGGRGYPVPATSGGATEGVLSYYIDLVTGNLISVVGQAADQTTLTGIAAGSEFYVTLQYTK